MNINCCSLNSNMKTSSFFNFDCEGSSFYILIANNLEIKEQSYKFLHDTYINNGLGLRKKDSMWFSLSELLPNTVTIVVFKNNKMVATVSTLLDSEFGMPVDACFPDEIEKRRVQGHRMTEIFSLGVNVTHKESKKVICKLLNIVTIINYYIFKATQTLITVVPGHSKFYREKLLFKEYGQLGFHRKTGVGCMLLTHDHIENIKSNISFKKRTLFEGFYAEEEALKIIDVLMASIRPITCEEFKYFYYLRPELFNTDDLSLNQKKYVEYMLKGLKL